MIKLRRYAIELMHGDAVKGVGVVIGSMSISEGLLLAFRRGNEVVIIDCSPDKEFIISI